MIFHDYESFFKTSRNNGRLSMDDWLEFVLPEDRHRVMETIGRCTQGEDDVYTAVMRLRLGDGSVIWAQDRGWVVERHPDGRALRLEGFQQDISQVRRTEKELREMQAQLDAGARVSGMISWEWLCRRKKLLVGPQLFDELGYSEPEEIARISSDPYSIVHPEDALRMRRAIGDYLKGRVDEYREEARLRHRSGKYLWTVTSGAVTQRMNGIPVRMAGVTFNIDAQKKTQEQLAIALKQNEIFTERLQRVNAAVEENLRLSKGDVFRQRRLLSVVNSLALDLLNATPETFARVLRQSLKKVGQAVDADRVYILRNCVRDKEAGLRVSHFWSEELFSGSLHSHGEFFSYSRFGDWEDRFRRGELINSYVHSLPEKSRLFFAAAGLQSILLLPVHLDNRFWGVVYFGDSNKVRLSDEPELKTLQSSAVLMVLALMRNDMVAQLRKAMHEARASMHAKGMMLANVSHEIKTPLNAIIGMSAVAAKRPEKVPSALAKIDQAANRLLDVITDLLDMAGLDSGDFVLNESRFTLGEMLENVTARGRKAARAKKQKLSINIDACSSREFVADPVRLGRVLFILLDNAVKFTPEGGRVSVGISEARLEANFSHILIEVRDSGIGMDERAVSALFTPFEQVEMALARSFDGVGLGLAIAKRIVEMMGGTISVESAPGEGSVFRVALHLGHAEPEEGETACARSGEAGAQSLCGKKVLVAEDNEVNREIMKELLGTVCDLHFSENGKEAYERVRQSPDFFDMILMDIHMPVMDGYEASGKIRVLSSHIPIIAVTANNLPEDKKKRQQAGMNGYVGKPLNLSQLLAVMRKCI